ncbi:MAG: hypothetical protein ACK2UU_12885 [Anaerolineae bacterium]|jgi:hypothetical protein
MLAPVVYQEGSAIANAVARQMHNLVTYGPWDLDAASAMSQYGYDEAKWAEGQGVLAELVSSDNPARVTMAAAAWYEEAAKAARRALAGQPWVLAKLGLAASGSE